MKEVQLAKHVDAALEYLCNGDGRVLLLHYSNTDVAVSFFETTIRRLGGLLGAYHIWQLQREQQLGQWYGRAANTGSNSFYGSITSSSKSKSSFAVVEKQEREQNDELFDVPTTSVNANRGIYRQRDYSACFEDLIRDTTVKLQPAFVQFAPPGGGERQHNGGTFGAVSYFVRGEVSLGIPNNGTQQSSGGRTNLGLAEAGSNILEFQDAAAVLQSWELAAKAERLMQDISAEVQQFVHRSGRRNELPGRMLHPTSEIRPGPFSSTIGGFQPTARNASSIHTTLFRFNGEPTISAGTDSYYEYLLKAWLVANPDGGGANVGGEGEETTFSSSARKNDYLHIWVDSMRAMRSQLLRPIPDLLSETATSGTQKQTFYYLADTPGASTMQHLGCYVPGMMVLGLYGTEPQVQRHPSQIAAPRPMDGNITEPWEGARRVPFLVRAGFLADLEEFNHFLHTAKHLMRTCLAFHDADQRFLAPEVVRFVQGGQKATGAGGNGMQIVDGKNQLRPEILESLFYFYYFDVDITTDEPMISFPHWEDLSQAASGARASSPPAPTNLSRSRTYYQNYAWKIFSAFKQFAKAEHGYASSKVEAPYTKDDKEESFWLAETLKYLYLIFQPPIFMTGDITENEKVNASSGAGGLGMIDLGKFVLNTEAHPVRRG
ncbi:unnamed protein product [Amoebophrya sp. A120]|nr:unnamed protein product [Amoebophrya sp. A120]|eukprot:GSA120T00008873001.1